MSKLLHISFDQLLDVAEKPAAVDRQTTAHLAQCSDCSSRLERISQLIHRMKADESVDAPRDLIDYAVNIFKGAAGTGRPSFVRHVIAALSFDSSDRVPVFGLRSGQSATRQLLYNAAEHDIDLRIREEDRDHWIISGQVLGEECSGGQVELIGDAGSASGLLNEQCEFSLPAVPPGRYGLRLLLPQIELEVTQLEIGK